jgi:ParB-like chromosome segregation protein Spo0J
LIDLPARRLRRLHTDIVDELAKSMQQVGLLQPVLVAEADRRLIAGWHRFEAAKKLGWTRIRAVTVEDWSADLMDIMEIDENLVRADLSPAERPAHQAERKRFYEREFPQTRHGAVGVSRPRQKSRQDSDSIPPLPRYTADAAKKTGTSERTVQRAAASGESIPSVASRAGTHWTSQIFASPTVFFCSASISRRRRSARVCISVGSISSCLLLAILAQAARA